MGVPGFFLWLIKNYKNKKLIFNKDIILNNVHADSDIDLINKINNIDYLLLDTNCLIHPMCYSVINENNDLTDIDKLEDLMILKILEYIEKIYEYVNPKKGIYIAIDGVAPVAKIKQQRIRRHKSISDKQVWDNIKKKYNKEITNSWNSNAITPGTKFMDKLHNAFVTFIKKEKINNLNIIYSSYLTPGEGEHKLLQYINNNINLSYVIYGLDADLIFLSLTTHSSNIFLLRESNEINKFNTEDILNYVNIEILRELIVSTIKKYIIKEINILPELNNNLDFSHWVNNIDNNQLINDFICICYLLGNDFIPHIPSLEIYDNGIETLIINYAKIYIELNLLNTQNNNNTGIIQKECNINYIFFKKIINNLSLEEEYILKKNYNKKYKQCYDTDPYQKELFKIENIQFKINDPVKLGSDNHNEWRLRYYKHYWNINNNEIEEFSKELVKQYLIGIKWISLYYFDKCPSWNWYYPYNNPPFISDIDKYMNLFDFNNYNFELGKPLKPFIQLLIVLPYSSNYLLPIQLRKLIINPKSSISHFYIKNFEQDFINKKKYWMAIPILPNLDINKIKYYFYKYKNELNDIDNNRNIFIDIITN